MRRSNSSREINRAISFLERLIGCGVDQRHCAPGHRAAGTSRRGYGSLKAVALSELWRLVSRMRPEAGALGPYDPRQPHTGSLTRGMGHQSSVPGILAVLAVASAHAASGAAKPGRWIVFSAFPNGVPPAQLFRVQVTNEGLQQITHSKDTSTQPAFSPNGKRVVFARLGSGIFVMNLFGSGLRRLTSGHHDFFPVYSPDGKRIAFTRQYRNDWHLYVMTAAGRQLHRLRHAPPSGRPSWTANGKSIYIPAQGSLAKVDARTGRLQKYIQPKMDVPSTATVSPNSRQVAFVGPRPSIPGCGQVSCLVFALYLADVSNGRVHRFVNDAGPAGWSSDGKTLVFVYRRGIILWPLAGGAQATLTTGPNVAQADAPPAWQPR